MEHSGEKVLNSDLLSQTLRSIAKGGTDGMKPKIFQFAYDLVPSKTCRSKGHQADLRRTREELLEDDQMHRILAAFSRDKDELHGKLFSVG